MYLFLWINLAEVCLVVICILIVSVQIRSWNAPGATRGIIVTIVVTLWNRMRRCLSHFCWRQFCSREKTVNYPSSSFAGHKRNLCRTKRHLCNCCPIFEIERQLICWLGQALPNQIFWNQKRIKVYLVSFATSTRSGRPRFVSWGRTSLLGRFGIHETCTW